jgi:hypothetical protein
MTALMLGLLVLLLLLNGLFVLAEFATVKVRASQIEVLKQKHPRDAALLQHIHDHMDEYLSVCQLGITFASIGLGFVGEPAIAKLLLTPARPRRGRPCRGHHHQLHRGILPAHPAGRTGAQDHRHQPCPEKSALLATAGPCAGPTALLYCPCGLNGSRALCPAPVRGEAFRG